MKKIVSLLCIVSLSLLVITGCSSKNGVKVWDTVSVTYIASFADGEIFDQNTEQTPITFTVGSGLVIQGLDEGVVGMTVGKTKAITVKPEKWYGKFYDKNNVQKISQFIFDQMGIQTKKWTTQTLGTLTWVIQWTEKDENGNTFVLFDINPRQTRDTLKYKVTILTKNDITTK